MNVFEFLLVIVSIVLGLAVTELLAGFVRIRSSESWSLPCSSGSPTCSHLSSVQHKRLRRTPTDLCGQRAGAERPAPANARSISWIDAALSQSRAPRNLATTRPFASTSTVTGILEAPSMCSKVQRGPESM